MPRATSDPNKSASPQPVARKGSVAPEDDLYEAGTGLAKYACEQCKRRKLKCGRTVPACVFCSDHGHECVYSKIVRTPLTRKNLDTAEKQIQNLQELLTKHYSEEQIRGFLDGGSLPRRGGAAEASALPANNPPPASLPPLPPSVPMPASASAVPPFSPILATPASMPPPPPPIPAAFPTPAALQSATAFPQPPVFPSPRQSFPPPQLSPASAASTSSPIQPFAPIASTSALHLSLTAPVDPLAELSRSPPFATRPALPPAPPSFPSAAAASLAQLPPAMVSHPPAHDKSTPAESTEGDGMGALTVEEGGASGYLGSLSGAALLQFLQRCAADVNLSAKGGSKSAASPSSTIGSQAHLSAEQLSRYVDAYFRVFHHQYPLVHEASFKAQLADIVPRPGGAAWNLLYATILGIGSMCVLGETEGAETTALYERATAAVNSALFESASLTAVQAFVLLGNFAQKLNHPSSGSVFLGIALRMAINLGLHCEASGKMLSPFEQEQRRRVWWVFFCFDSGAQLTFGYPSTLPHGPGVDVLPIANISDSSFTPTAFSRPPSTDNPTVYSACLHQAYYAAFANRVTEHLTSRSSISVQDTFRMTSELQVLQSSLPQYFFSGTASLGWFDFPRHQMCWRLDALRLLILRQLFLKVSLSPSTATKEEGEAWDMCVACACAGIKSVSGFVEAGPRSAMEWWYSLHFLFPSVFIPLIALRIRPSSPSAIDWVVSIQSAKSVLERVPHALLKSVALRGVMIIEALANLEVGGDGTVGAPPVPQTETDFSAFLEMLAGPSELDGAAAGTSTTLPAPGLLGFGDLDSLFQWFTPSGSPQPQPM